MCTQPKARSRMKGRFKDEEIRNVGIDTYSKDCED
jgi:hypothetical protein